MWELLLPNYGSDFRQCVIMCLPPFLLGGNGFLFILLAEQFAFGGRLAKFACYSSPHY